MSESTVFDDLELLDGGDLKSVFEQVAREEVVAALWGANASLRGRLLLKLAKRHATPIQQAIDATEHLTFEAVRNAQQKIVAAMCQLSRGGQIAFDVPEDMAA